MLMYIGYMLFTPLLLLAAQLASAVDSRASRRKATTPRPEYRKQRLITMSAFLLTYFGGITLLVLWYRQAASMKPGWQVAFAVWLALYLSFGTGDTTGKRTWWRVLGVGLFAAFVLMLFHAIGVTHHIFP